jgi:hypothetical protein
MDAYESGVAILRDPDASVELLTTALKALAGGAVQA